MKRILFEIWRRPTRTETALGSLLVAALLVYLPVRLAWSRATTSATNGAGLVRLPATAALIPSPPYLAFSSPPPNGRDIFRFAVADSVPAVRESPPVVAPPPLPPPPFVEAPPPPPPPCRPPIDFLGWADQLDRRVLFFRTEQRVFVTVDGGTLDFDDARGRHYSYRAHSLDDNRVRLHSSGRCNGTLELG